jgi:hypothetical protein
MAGENMIRQVPARVTLAIVVVAFVSIGPKLHAECPVYDTERLDDGTADDRRTADMPVAPFDVHEWGVWRLGSHGRVASLADLVRESPSFVHRAPDAAGRALVVPATRMPQYETCDKPVIFLHAHTTLDVNLTVRFPTGRPWLHYPAATIGNVGGVRSAQWSGRVLADETLPEGRSYPATGATHWWNHLRDAHASPFVPAEGTEAERFIFYDGETEFPQGFRIRRRRPVPISGRVDTVAWILDRDGPGRLAVEGESMSRRPIAGIAELRADMRIVLIMRGLTAGEADALLDTWRSNLFEGSEKRVMWMLRRDVYDAILPLDVTPRPTTIVRVGLVIQQY